MAPVAAGATLGGNYFSPREARDGKALAEWFGTRPWSTGKVGMAGGSYVGITQLLTAARRPSTWPRSHRRWR